MEAVEPCAHELVNDLEGLCHVIHSVEKFKKLIRKLELPRRPCIVKLFCPNIPLAGLPGQAVYPMYSPIPGMLSGVLGMQCHLIPMFQPCASLV
jgi:hypothetical protein